MNENARVHSDATLSNALYAHVDVTPVDLEINPFGLFPPLERYRQRFHCNVRSHGLECF